MRNSIITILKALYEAKEVTTNKNIVHNTTLVTNDISFLRNVLNVDIITDRIGIEHLKWYGSYRLVKTNQNLKQVRAILGIYSKHYEIKVCKICKH